MDGEGGICGDGRLGLELAGAIEPSPPLAGTLLGEADAGFSAMPIAFVLSLSLSLSPVASDRGIGGGTRGRRSIIYFIFLLTNY